MDWFDLNDWVLFNYPELHQATKYLSQDAQITCWEEVYNKSEKQHENV